MYEILKCIIWNSNNEIDVSHLYCCIGKSTFPNRLIIAEWFKTYYLVDCYFHDIKNNLGIFFLNPWMPYGAGDVKTVAMLGSVS